MNRNLKIALFCLASGALTLAGCGWGTFMQWLGDITADTIFLRGID